MDVRGKDLRRVTPMGIWSRHPAWAPDGDWIAYDMELEKQWGNPKELDQNIYIVPANGGKPRQITGDAGKNRDPAWVPEEFFSVSPSAEMQTTLWGGLKQAENVAR